MVAPARDDDYSWIFYLAVVFFTIVLPILKKAAQALTGKKKTPLPAPRPHLRGKESVKQLDMLEEEPPRPRREEPDALTEMLEGMEEFFRRSRGGARAQGEPRPAQRPGREKVSPDVPKAPGVAQAAAAHEEQPYQQDESELEEALVAPEKVFDESPPPTDYDVPPHPEEAESLGVIKEPVIKKTSLKAGLEVARQAREGDMFEVLSELPEEAKALVLGEILFMPGWRETTPEPS
jgi:hypothetical protein